MLDRLSGAANRPLPQLLLVSLAVYGCLFPFLSWTTFSADDAHIMRVAIEYNWAQAYFNHDVYTQLSLQNFTPFALSVYRLILILFALSSNAFLGFMLISISLFTALAGYLCYQLCKCKSCSMLAMLLIFSNFSLHTLITRFYTVHYITGGVFALLAMIFLLREPGKKLDPWLSGAFLLLALLSKEVYLVLVPIMVILSLKKNEWQKVGAALIAFLAYGLLRAYTVGFPSLDGSADWSYTAGLWTIGISGWLNFFFWYFKTHLLILSAAVLGLIFSPSRMLTLLPIALLFGLPALAAPHGILQPELHGDRIFFAMSSAIAIAAVLALHESSHSKYNFNPAVLSGVLCAVLLVHGLNVSRLKEQELATADHKITTFMLENEDEIASKTLFVPMVFSQGNLINVQSMLNIPSAKVTHNCLLALSVADEALIAFDNEGDRISREQLQTSCQPGSAVVGITIPPRIAGGLIEWDLQYSDGFSGGVLFVDRAFAAPVPAFSSIMARPRPGERYQIFARKGNQWWFSEIKPIEILN